MSAIVLSANFGYLDIALVVLIALFLLWGLWRGISKSLKGFFLMFPILLLSLYFVGLSYLPARNFSLSEQLQQALTTSSVSWGASFTEPIFVDPIDGVQKIRVGENLVTFTDADGLVKGNIAKLLASKFVTTNGVSLANVVVDNLTGLLIMIILFILFCIGLSIVFAVLRKLTRGMHESDSGGVKALDRCLGAILSIGLLAIFVLFVFGILASLENKIPTAIDYIKSNVFSDLIYSNNPIATMLTNIFVGK